PARQWSSDRVRGADPAGSRRRRPNAVIEAVRPVLEWRNPGYRRTRFGSRAALPFSRARQFADTADNEVPLDAAEAVDEQHAVQVIHFVLKGTREERRAFVLPFDSRPVQTLDDRSRGPHDRRIEARHAEAAFFFELYAVLFDEL